MQLRPYGPTDAGAVLALNQGALEAVSRLDGARLDTLVGLADRAVVVGDGDTLAGFALVFAPGCAYDSVNYAWFGERYDDFRYIDRVVVAPAHRRRGVGTLLYDHVEEAARPAGRTACEVYAEPPNIASLGFHAVRGYVDVGRLAQTGGKTCAMLVKELG